MGEGHPGFIGGGHVPKTPQPLQNLLIPVNKEVERVFFNQQVYNENEPRFLQEVGAI